jgi:GNAT superfamily N-acetyltransferase
MRYTERACGSSPECLAHHCSAFKEVTIMATKPSIQVGALRVDELEEAGRIVRLAFGTFLGLPNPLEFMGDREFVTPRWRARNTKLLAARDNGKLVGSNIATRWGSFAFFGPLTVLPEYWNRGVAQQLLAATMKIFERWGVRHSALFTFPQSPRHVRLYQKFGYWPGSLTALMKRAPAPPAWALVESTEVPVLLSSLAKKEQAQAIAACARLTNTFERGLDLGDELRAVVAQRIGEVILIEGRRAQDAFAVCMHGAGSEGGAKTCYVKFAAARSVERFEHLLDAIDAFALAQGSEVEAGVSLACKDAFERMRARGYRAVTMGVAMQKPHGDGFNRATAYVLNDWR